MGFLMNISNGDFEMFAQSALVRFAAFALKVRQKVSEGASVSGSRQQSNPIEREIYSGLQLN
jgi:hypothetical protein